MSQTRRSLGSTLKDNPFIKRDPRWTPNAEEKQNPLEGGNKMEQRSPTPKARGRSFTPQGTKPTPPPLPTPPVAENENDTAIAEDTASDNAAALSAAAPPFAPVPAPFIPDDNKPPTLDTSPAPPPPPAAAGPAHVESQPPPPPPDVSSLDTFEQTGAAQDDLFDEIEPVDDSMRVRSEEDLFGDDFTPLAQPVVEEPVPAPAPQPVRSRAEPQRGRGRGRGRGRSVPGRGQQQSEVHISHQNGNIPPQADPPTDAPSGPRKETHSSVRGDRRATGGNVKPKLTEEELAEKMARIQIKNASLTAAHARAEADAAIFAEREEAARVKTRQKEKEERRDRQQMMGERERNRQRKLKGMVGREWDAEKDEDDFRKGGLRDKKGGFAGDQAGYSDGREYLYREPRRQEERRGGGRGARGGRGGDAAAPPRQEDFPALPAAAAPPVAASGASGGAMASPAAPGKSWADQVEAS